MTTEITLSQRAADIMSSPAITVTQTATLSDAARTMVRKNIGALPVVDDNDEFAGMLTERILQAKLASIRPASSLSPENRVILELFELNPLGSTDLERAFAAARRAAVADAMIPNPATVSESMPVWEVSKAMLDSHASHIAVLRDRRVVGVISRHDLMKAYLER